MLIKQLSLFLENKPGALNAVCQILKERKINIRTLSLADTQQFGILRLLVEEWEEAETALEGAGLIVKVTDVLALPVPDHPGGLADLLAVLDKGELSVEYMYAFTACRGENAIIVFRFEDTDKAIKVLKANKIDVIKSVELFNN